MRNCYDFYHNTYMNLTSTCFFLFDITATIAVLVVGKIVGENKQTVRTKRGKNILIEKENITAAAVEIKCTMIMKMMMVILFPWM